MTVNTIDIAAAESRAETICVRLDSIAENLDAVLPLIREAIAAEDHLTLGYKGISDYVQDRFGGALTRLPVDLRRPVVHELAQAGMSTRAIAPVVGVSPATAKRDVLSGGSHEPPEPAEQAHVNTDTGEVLDQRPEPRKSTGLDGKQYTRPEPKPRPEPEPEPSIDQRKQREEMENHQQHCRVMAEALAFLGFVAHPERRAGSINDDWRLGWDGASPSTRTFHSPDHIRAVANGLALYADELETHNG